MTIFRRFVVMVLIAWFQMAQAEVSAITVAAKVKSFDEKTVTVIVHRRVVVLPRSSVTARDLKTGDAVLITLRGDQVRYLFEASSEKGRAPASERKSH